MKQRIIGFILGAVVFGSVGLVSGAILYQASEIGYTPKNNTWKKSNGDKIETIEDAIDELYNISTCEEWTEISGATATNTDYIYNNSLHLYKCGSVCKISFAMDGVNLNTDYQLITDAKYYPKANTNGSGVGQNNGYINYTLKTDGNIVITMQSNASNGWASGSSLAYICGSD